MEPTSFNLERAIDKYIVNVNNQGSLTSADEMELTAHLYDSTADLQRNNLTEEEAFLVATKRLGNESLLTQEYSKVNPSIHTNKVWAYLFIGFNLLYTMPSFIVIAIIGVYYGIYFYFQNSIVATVLVTSFHILFTFCVWLIVFKKNKISEFIDKQVSNNSFRITMVSFLPLLMFFFVNPQFRRLRLDDYLYYPMREWNGSVAEFTYYLAVLSIIGVVLCLIFTINNKEKFSLKVFFEKPSYLFLVCFGIFIECLASTTRTLQIGIIIEAIIFGLIYATGAFLISYFNRTRVVLRITVFVLFGSIIETSVGISNDLDRGNFYLTTCFVSALIIGTFLGWFFGSRYGQTYLSTQSA